MEVRTMSIRDYEEVYRLWTDTPGMGLNSLDDSREGIARYLARNPRTCLVSIRAGRITGVILSGHDGRRGFIYHLAVTVAERGRGVGSALVREALCALAGEGITKACLLYHSPSPRDRQ